MAAQLPDVGSLTANASASTPPGLHTGTLVPGRFQDLSRQLELWGPVSFLVLMVLACFVWPEIYPVPSPVNASLLYANLPPLSPGHIFGTDPLGNDIMARILFGGRVSLEVGLGANALGMLIGGMLGTFAGVKGGIIESIIMRILDVFLAFPSLVLAIVIATYLGPSEIHVIWAISFFSIPAFARLSRAATLRLREQTYVLASKLFGASDTRMVLKHLGPGIVPQLLTFSLLGVAIAIIVEASLSFLGLGVPPPGPSWGNMISAGEPYLSTNPWLVLIPGIFLFATVIALNLLGDALRERLGLR